MIRASYFAFALICFSSGHAKADNFTFSFTNTDGNVNGTVTGEIFGLIDDGSTHSATSVVLNSYPNGLKPFDTNPSLTTWDKILANQFIESSGTITSAFFEVHDTASCLGTGCYFHLILPDATNESFIDVDDGLFSRDVSTNTDPTFTLIPSAVPEPSAVYLLLTVLGVVAIVARRRHAQGLAVGPPPE